MNLSINIINDVLALVLLYILLNNVKNRKNKNYSIENKLSLSFITLSLVAVCLGIFNYLSFRFIHIKYPLFYNIIYSLYCLFYILPIFCWISCFDYEIYKLKKRAIRLHSYIFLIFIIHVAILIVNLITKKFFYYDNNMQFVSSKLNSSYVSIIYFITLVPLFTLIRNTKNIRKEDFHYYLGIVLPPIICVFIELFSYRQSLLFLGLLVSSFVIFLRHGTQDMNIDYLTQAFSRRHLDIYLNNKIKNMSSNDHFTGFMVDVDNFKIINDCYGHSTGDKALIDIVSILRKSFDKDSFIARYAGDEFVIISNIYKYEDISAVLKNIKHHINIFNKDSKRMHYYSLSLSVGFEVYDANCGLEQDEFIKIIDSKMYHNKVEKKKVRSNYR